MNIHHRPEQNTAKVEEIYSEKDGVPVTYVCTSAILGEATCGDIFYRETPHPEFGNHYFILRNVAGRLWIGDADNIEDARFVMVEGSNGWEYSRHRHDFYEVPGTGVAVDGGRAYFRAVGDLSEPTKTFCVKDGKFVEVELKRDDVREIISQSTSRSHAVSFIR
jgi:hypothetical protein